MTNGRSTVSGWVRVVAVVATVAFLFGAGFAAPAGAKGTKVVSVTSQFHDPGAIGFSNPSVACVPPQPSVCTVGFHGRVDWTGGLQGSSTYRAIGYPGKDATSAMRWEVWETFTGSVAGCGKGTLSWYGAGTIDFTRSNPLTLTTPMEGTLHIGDPSSGDLAGINGKLEAVASMSLAPLFGEQHGKVSGKLTCSAR